MATLSIALALYNGEKYLEQQLSSLLRQTRPADEVILCDDCSTDRTPELAERFIEEHGLAHWKLLRNEQNEGYKGNFYRALGHTTKDLIFLCDQDDCWLPNKLEEMAQLCEAHPDILSLSSSFTMVDGQGAPLEQPENPGWSNHGLVPREVGDGELVSIPFTDILQYNLFPGCTTVIRRELKERYLQSSERQMPHDWELNLLAGSEGGLYFYNRPLIAYRIHGNNTIGQSTNRHEIKFKMESTREKRLRIVEEYLGHARFLSKPAIRDMLPADIRRAVPGYHAYLQARQDFLKRGRFSAWLRSLGRYPRAKTLRWIHFRHLLGDLAAVYR